MASCEQLLEQLRQLVDRVPPALRSMSEEQAASGSGPDKWSAKQELGHLLDSAVVNHYRWVRVLFEDNPTLSGYDGPAWVSMHDYQQRGWSDLIETWVRLNEHMLMLAEGIPASGWERSAIFDARPATLEFMLNDYVHHAAHHLAHVTGLSKAELGVQGAERAIA
ncbi:MAG TPA: DinB family protein [Terriglobales bacterium]|nr:DinB family protein [Terriglobales bacterium]